MRRRGAVPPARYDKSDIEDERYAVECAQRAAAQRHAARARYGMCYATARIMTRDVLHLQDAAR